MTETELLYRKYRNMMPDCGLLDERSFSIFVSEALKGLECVRIEEKTDLGVMYYSLREENGLRHCGIPLLGYYAESEKMTVRLFQKLAENVVSDMSCRFSANLYSSDAECIRAFQMMQFGNMAEKGIRKLGKNSVNTKFDIRILPKNEITGRWSDVWALVRQIIIHLRKSPVFYPGKEFTEELYRDFFMSDCTEVIAAFDEGRMTGIIEWNSEENKLLCGNGRSVNIGEAFVIPPLRGTGLAESLLYAAEKRAKEAGAEYMWVEHGTANPNARGFWNKYFKTCQYLLVRTVEQC